MARHPDTLDPFPYDPFKLADLRAAGPDGVFDTADDQIITEPAILRGGPLAELLCHGRPAATRQLPLTVTSSMRDRFGNSLARRMCVSSLLAICRLCF